MLEYLIVSLADVYTNKIIVTRSSIFSEDSSLRSAAWWTYRRFSPCLYYNSLYG